MNINNQGMRALSADTELIEIQAIGRQVVKLKRTFNMSLCGQTLKFWRVIAPATHRNINSDLSIEGLKEWGIIS